MAKLDVHALCHWVAEAGEADDFHTAPMLLALSVTDSDGNRVDVRADDVRVGYQYRPEVSEDSIADISDFHRNGPSFGDARWSSCVVHPQQPDSWGTDEVVVLVTVRRPREGGGFDKGQKLVLASYRHRVPASNALIDSLSPALADIRQGLVEIDKDARRLATKIEMVQSSIAMLSSSTGRLTSGISARTLSGRS